MRRPWNAILLACALVCLAHAQPAKPDADPLDPLLADAEQAIATSSLPDFASSVESRLKPLLADLENAGLVQLTNLTVWREVARLGARIEEPDESQTETIQWLIRHPRVMQRLMLALEDEARREGRRLLHLDTNESDKSNRLYQSVGYTMVGSVPNWAVGADGALHGTTFYYKVLD